jgi:hypothetical protein
MSNMRRTHILKQICTLLWPPLINAIVNGQRLLMGHRQHELCPIQQCDAPEQWSPEHCMTGAMQLL